MQQIPLSLYIHIPWCVRKCPYCDFNSHAVGEELPEAAYVDALLADLEADLPRVWGRRIGTIFIGGGTPSLFSAEAMDRLLAGVRARLPFSGQAEVTLEANPGTVEAGRFAEYRSAGVNRLSIGVQSFSDGALQRLGRIHTAAEAERAIEFARAAGFDNLNLDLMFGLPGQTPALARADLERALGLEPEHLSYYQLTLEPNTPFAHRPPQLPDDEVCDAIQIEAIEHLAVHGYGRYEVSAYARAGRCCRHNLNYWRFGDYLGIGAGAHGKLSDASGVRRLWKHRHPRAYLKSGDQVAGENRLEEGDLVLEFMMNALRLTNGFAPELFDERTGLDFERIHGPLQRARDRGLLERKGGQIVPTDLGRRFLNDLVEIFMVEDNELEAAFSHVKRQDGAVT